MKKITLLFLLISNSIFATTYFVDQDAAGTGSGTSWANAFTNLQTAINTVIEGDLLFVKAGNYYPSQQMISGDNRSRAFLLNKNIKIYGGFNGTETTLAQRNFTTNVTLLSGDFNDNDTDTNGNGINDFGQGENAYTVLVAYGLSNTALIDGVKFFGGNADGTATYTYNTYSLTTSNAGGIYNVASNLVVKNTVFNNNSGSFGGGFCNKGACFPKIENCNFIYNFASYGNSIHANDGTLVTILNSTFTSNRGSGVLSSLNSSVMKVTGCTFSNNQGSNGGVSYTNNNCNSVFLNCKMYNNTATNSGGAFYMTDYCIVTMYNTLVYKNYAVYGGAIYSVSNSYFNCINSTFYGNNASTKGGAFYCSVSPDAMYMKLYNTIIYGNTSPTNPNWFREYFTVSNIHVRNSIIQGSGGSAAWSTNFGTNDGNNLDVNPLFTNTTQDVEDFRLQATSPGIDTSYNLLLNLPNSNNSWTSSDTDVYGNSRLVGNGVDIGAAENQSILSIFEYDNSNIKLFCSNSKLLFEDADSILNKAYTIFDLNGKKVIEGKINSTEILLPTLVSGLYVIKIENEKGIKFLIKN
jgi:predicted outer membrane repeat protein